MTEADVQLAGAQTIREAIAVMDLLPTRIAMAPLDLNLTVSLPQEQLDQLNRIEDAIHQLQGALVTVQEDIDAAKATLEVDSAALRAAGDRILAEIATLEGQGVDTSGLKAAVADLDTSVGSVGNIVPAPVAAFVTKVDGETFVDYQTRLFTYNSQVPADQQAPSLTEDEWNAAPVG